MIRFKPLFATLVVAALAACAQKGGTDAKDIVATVDGKPISRNTYEEYVKGVASQPAVDLTEEQRTQIFRPFFTTKRNGTGLGLASSRAIVEAHQGSIGVEELAAGGTCFWFSLPAAVETSSR